ncbi:MAG: hypothetical protein SPL13_01885 [Clostridia bacterium]|nr:hypothetical protein [Clostridia bacterium]
MKEYTKARNNMREKIREAFWSLYKRYNYQNVMSIREIIDTAKINRSTFYFYYDHTGEVLDELINWLKDEIVDIYSSRTRRDGDFNGFYKEMYEHFKTRKKFLVPLVCESRHPEFALWYRNNQREMFKEDIGLAHYRTDKQKNKIIDIALSGIIEEQIQTFGYGELSIDDSFYLEYGMLQNGLLHTLKSRFGILTK